MESIDLDKFNVRKSYRGVGTPGYYPPVSGVPLAVKFHYCTARKRASDVVLLCPQNSFLSPLPNPISSIHETQLKIFRRAFPRSGTIHIHLTSLTLSGAGAPIVIYGR